MKLLINASKKAFDKSGRTSRLWLQSCYALVVALGVGSVAAQTPATAPAATKATAANAAVAAKPAAAVTVLLTQAKVVKGADGKEQLLDAATVKPGDVIEYRATYTNRSAKPVTGVVATLPIPEGLQYQPLTAKPGATLVQAAVKGGDYSAEPLIRTVAGKVQPVPYAEYRSLRWSLGQLPAGGSAAVSARAFVQVFVPTAASGVAGAGAAQKLPASAAKP